MKVCILGLWHLGSVISACVASEYNEVIGVDEDLRNIKNLNKGKAPVYEPGLNKLIKKKLKSKNLIFTNDKKKAKSADILWIAFDTPINKNDDADVYFVEKNIKKIIPYLEENAVILFSSQLPVGTIKKIQKYCKKKFPKKNLKFACSPENLRLGNALKSFLNPDRIIVGIDDSKTKNILNRLFKPMTNQIEWMKIESAEMTKHTINSFLATSITFANEIAAICEKVGANYFEIEKGVKSDNRIGQKAYLSAGKPIAGGTLLRDVRYLNNEKKKYKLSSPLLSSIVMSNNKHKKWVFKKLINEFKTLTNISITVWGLTYKPYTDSLRRSLSVELCDWLVKQKAKVHVFDPAVKKLPKHWDGKIKKYSNALDSIKNSDALIIGTFWPEFKKLTNKIKRTVKKKLVIIDPDNKLKIRTLKSNIRCITFGN